jgi:Mrp family chromosome partitioning ATPase
MRDPHSDPAEAPVGTQPAAAVGLFESAWRHRVVILVVVVLAAAGGYLISSRQAATYQATTTLLFSDGTGMPFGQSALPAQDHVRYLATQADRMTSGAVTTAAARALNDGTSPADIAAHVWAVPAEASDTLTVTATAPEAARAARLADAVAAGYLAVLRSEARSGASAEAASLQRQYDDVRNRIGDVAREPRTAQNTATMEGLQGQLRDLATDLSRLQMASREYEPAVQVLSEAAVPGAPISPTRGRDAGLAAIIALLLSSAAAWGFEVRTQRRSDAGRFSRLLDARYLGRVPYPAVMPRLDPGGEPVVPGQWQQVVSAVDASMQEVAGRCLLVTAPIPSVQASLCAVNLALAAAADGRSVVLVDADYTTRDMSVRVGVPADPGLTDLVERRARLQSSYRAGEGGRPAVALLPPGRPVANPAAFYRTASFRTTLAAIGQRADLVVVVGPSLLAGPDTGVLADAANAVLLLVADTMTAGDLVEARSALTWSSGELLGYVVVEQAPRTLNRRRPPATARVPAQRSSGDASQLASFVKPLRVVAGDETANSSNGIPTSALRLTANNARPGDLAGPATDDGGRR